MATVVITYHAPPGDQPYCETRGVKFFDGQPVAVDDAQHAELIAKCRTNMHFSVSEDRRVILDAIKPHIEHSHDAPRSVEHDENRMQLVAEAEGLGIKVDGRWSDKRLETEISKAKIEAAS